MTREEAYGIAEEHWRTAEVYWNNAEDAARMREWPKVSELAWGFASQGLKAYGALQGRMWSTHKGTLDFMRDLAKGTGDVFFNKAIPDLNNLHQNFYEPGQLDDQQVRERAWTAWEVVRRLWALLDNPPS